MNKFVYLLIVFTVLSITLIKGFVLPSRMLSTMKNMRNALTFTPVKSGSTRLFAEASSMKTLQTIGSDKKKLGVLLLNLGGPEKLDVRCSNHNFLIVS
jgi:hypothetical protein